jgi:DUF4097 and DUF4098 domain-containing protein YvlB
MRLTEIGRMTVLAAALVAVPVAATAAQKETETIDRTVRLPDKGTLKLKNFSGAIHITGTNGRDVVVKAVRRADRERLDHIKLDIQTTGSTVTIQANKRDADWEDRRHDDNVVETSFEIQVPTSADLDVNAFSSDLDISGVTGDEKLETFSGAITVAGAKGAIRAHSFSGNIEIDATGTGTSPALSADTFSGQIRARLAGNAKGSVSFDSFSGSFDSEVPLLLHSSNRRRLSADLPGGSGGGTLHFHTFSGSVKVTK